MRKNIKTPEKGKKLCFFIDNVECTFKYLFIIEKTGDFLFDIFWN